MWEYSKIKVWVFCSQLSLNSHYRSGSWLCGTWAKHQALGNIITVDLTQSCAQRIDAGTVLACPVRQQRSDRILFLLESCDPLLLISKEARQVVPVAVMHVVAVISFVASEKQLLHFLSGVERKEETRLLIHVDDCGEKLRGLHFIS